MPGIERDRKDFRDLVGMQFAHAPFDPRVSTLRVLITIRISRSSSIAPRHR